MYDRYELWRDVPQTSDADYFSDPTTLYPELDESDDPDSDYFDKVYGQGWDDGYAIGRYERALAQDNGE